MEEEEEEEEGEEGQQQHYNHIAGLPSFVFQKYRKQNRSKCTLGHIAAVIMFCKKIFAPSRITNIFVPRACMFNQTPKVTERCENVNAWCHMLPLIGFIGSPLKQ